MNFKKILAVASAVFFLSACGGSLSESEAKETALDFTNNYLLTNGVKASILNILKKENFYEIDFELSKEGETATQNVSAYLTLDGKQFIPQKEAVLDVSEFKKSVEEVKEREASQLQELPKNEKPVVELFVMSHCPFGTQIEKGILPVIETLGDKIDFQLKFVNYAMHAKTEVDEETLQVAIRNLYPEKLIPYLKAFLKDGNTEDALSAVELTQVDLASEIARLDEEFQINANYDNKEEWLNGKYPKYLVDNEANEKYGVGGSPTLVINGFMVEGAGRDSASLLKAVCSAFTTQPAECATELSTTAPSSGFGYGEGSSDGGTCG